MTSKPSAPTTSSASPAGDRSLRNPGILFVVAWVITCSTAAAIGGSGVYSLTTHALLAVVQTLLLVPYLRGRSIVWGAATLLVGVLLCIVGILGLALGNSGLPLLAPLTTVALGAASGWVLGVFQSIALREKRRDHVSWIRVSTIAWTIAAAATSVAEMALGENFGMRLFRYLCELGYGPSGASVAVRVVGGLTWGVPVALTTAVALSRFLSSNAPRDMPAAQVAAAVH